MSINIEKINNIKTNNSLNCNSRKLYFAKTKSVPNDSFEFSRPITRTFTGCGDKVNKLLQEVMNSKNTQALQDKVFDVEIVDHVPSKMRLVSPNKKAAQQSANIPSSTVQRSYMEVDGNNVTINVSKYQEEFDEFMRNFPNI